MLNSIHINKTAISNPSTKNLLKLKIINKLKKNITPIFEPNLKDLIETSTKEGKLSFVNNLKNLNTANIIWFTYDTPVNENDQADTKYVVDRIKNTLKKLKSNKYVIISSQLPVGTIKLLENYSKNILKKKFYFLNTLKIYYTQFY